MFIVVRISVWHISYCCTLIRSSSLVKQTSKSVLERMPTDVTDAATLGCRCDMALLHPPRLPLKGLAKIQSSGFVNSVLRCHCISTLASAGSSGIYAREYSVLTSKT